MSDRSAIVSSFTIVKGALIEEAYQVLAAWNLKESKRENLDRVRSGELVSGSETWRRDVAKVFNRRFDPNRDRALIVLAKGSCPLQTWKPVLLWHITRDEFLLRDFLVHFLFPLHSSGALRIRQEEVMSYLDTIESRGAITEHKWAEKTRERVAAGLFKMAVDFDLLVGSVHRELTSYHLADDAFLYVLHAIHQREQNGQRMMTSDEWKMFMMSPSDVEHDLFRLHQFRRLEFQVAGTLGQLTLPCSSAEQFAERMVA